MLWPPANQERAGTSELLGLRMQGMGMYGQHMMHMHHGMGMPPPQSYGFVPAGQLGQPGQEPNVHLGHGPMGQQMLPAYPGYHPSHGQMVRLVLPGAAGTDLRRHASPCCASLLRPVGCMRAGLRHAGARSCAAGAPD